MTVPNRRAWRFGAPLLVLVVATTATIIALRHGVPTQESRAEDQAPSAAASTMTLPVGSAASESPVAAAAPESAAVLTGCAHEPAIEEDPLPVPLSLFPLVGERPDLFGSASLGTPTRGSLWAGVPLRSGGGIQRAGDYAWGTASVVRSVVRAVREVRRCHADTPTLFVGDISRQHGGWLRPHRSHQAGLDADIGYYYVGPPTWYQRATAKNLDVVRTWALVDAFISGGNVDTIFMDRSVQALLKTYLATLPESERPPDDTFESPLKRDALIRHAWGHATHFHVRFRDPDASALGARIDRFVGRDPRARAWLKPRH